MLVRIVAIIAALTSSAQPPEVTVLFDRPIDATYRMRIEAVRGFAAGDRGAVVRATVLERNGRRSWALLSFTDLEARFYQVERVTARVVVLSWMDEPYGSTAGNVKFFLDLDAKRVDRRIDYPSATAVEFATEVEARTRLGVTPAELRRLRSTHVFADSKPEAITPPLFTQFPLQQSTTRAVMATRPHFRKSGLTEEDIGVGETVGAFQSDASGFWFGKTFYDAEGDTGIGAIGHLDAAGHYEFLRMPEAVDWSVNAILVEGDTIWAGLVHHGEGRDLSGGLLQHDRQTGRTILHDVPDVIHTIVRSANATFLGTDHGLYAVRSPGAIRYRMEPDIEGRLATVSQHLSTVPPRPRW